MRKYMFSGLKYILLSKVSHILTFCGEKVPSSGVTYFEFNMDIVHDPSCLYVYRQEG